MTATANGYARSACLKAALGYLDLGLSAIPLCPGDHLGVGREHVRSCDHPGKRPFFPTRNGLSSEWKAYQSKRADPDELEREWHYHPGLNVGCALGPVSGSVAVDVDTEDGEQLLRDLSGGELPPTWTFNTGKGSRLIYELPAGREAPTRTFTRPETKVEILKFMGQGSQTVMPPSTHATGTTYGWARGREPGDLPRAPVPDWWFAARTGQDRAAPPTDDEASISEGGRHVHLRSLAGGMRYHGAGVTAITAALLLENERLCRPPLLEKQVRDLARDIAAKPTGGAIGVTIELPGEKPEQSEPHSAADVARIADLKQAGAEVRWLWLGWVQHGVLTAFAAEGATGKTRTMADLVRRIRHGLPWPDGTPMTVETRETVALWVVADNHHDELVTVCDTFGITDCVAVNAHPADPFGGVVLEAPSDFAMLEKRVAAVKPLLVIVDTVGNATDRNLSVQDEARAFYQPLQILARRQGVALACLTHLNANSKVLGRRALEKVRVCLRMSAEQVNDANCKRRLEVVKSNARSPDPLGVTMGDAGNEYDHDPPPPPEDRDTVPGVSPKVRECMNWLEEQVKDRARQVTELRSEAENKGFSAKVLYVAKRGLGLIEDRASGRLWWSRPGQQPNPPKIVIGQDHAGNPEL